MTMTVKMLRAALVNLPDDMLVIVRKDSVGSTYSPLVGVDGDNLSYRAATAWSGTVGLTTLTDEMKQFKYESDDVCAGGVPCLVLHPVT